MRRICELFDGGWTTYRIAQQLNSEGSRPVHCDYWYAPFIDGLLENPLLIGMPTWNRTSQSGFKHIEGGKIVATEKDQRLEVAGARTSKTLFVPISRSLTRSSPSRCGRKSKPTWKPEACRPKRSPRNEELWFGGLWVCGTTGQKLAGDANQKCLRVKHPAHQEKKLTFKQAEWFIGQWLEIVGKRIELLDEAAETKRLLRTLTKSEWLTELRFEYIRMDIENFLVAKLGEGHAHRRRCHGHHRLGQRRRMPFG